MHLRPANPDDALRLSDLGRESFAEAFGHLYRDDDLKAFLDEAHAPDKVAREIASDSFRHCLAEQGEQLLGYCKLRIPSGFAEYSEAHRPIALNQLYTAPGNTGKGIGAALIDWAITFARARGADAIQLSVYAENFGAQRFYERYGFARIADITFKVGSHIDPEFLYELQLKRRG